MIVGSVGRVRECEPREAFHRVLEGDKGFALLALAVDGHRIAGDGLCAEAVDDDAEVVVEVETSRQPRIGRCLIGLGPVGVRGPNI